MDATTSTEYDHTGLFRARRRDDPSGISKFTTVWLISICKGASITEDGGRCYKEDNKTWDHLQDEI